MKRDMDLIRELLLRMEEDPSGYAPKIVVSDRSEEEVGFHFYLMMQGGLIKGADISTAGVKSPQALPLSITWAGYEFLDAARDPTRWEKAKSMIKKAGSSSIPVSILTQVLASIAKTALGLP